MKDSPTELRRRLQATGRAKDTARRLAWALLIVATVLEVLLCAALLDYWLVLSTPARLGGFAGLVLVLGLGAGGWLRLRRRRATMKEAALDAETQREGLGCVVSTAAEYVAGERKATREYEPELVAALEDQAAKKLATVEVSYRRKWSRPAEFFAFALVTVLVFAAAVPVAFTAFKRTVIPWSKETYTHLEVTPGNADIPIGHDVAITNLFSGRLPKNPLLRWRYTDSTEWKSVALSPTENGLYLHAFKNVQAPLHYRVSGNDVASELYEISTYVPPEVRSVRLHVVFPEYTGVKPYDVEVPDLTVLRGTELSFRVTPSTALASAKLRFSTVPGVELSADKENQWRGKLKATHDADYWIELADAKGHRGGNEKPFHLKVLPDQPPKVDILEPGKDIQAEATNTVPLSIAAWDDYGVSEVKIVYHKLGGPERQIVCTLTNLEGGEVVTAAGLPLADLGLRDYELVAYHAEAKDNNTLDGPGIGMSPVYFIEITHEEGREGQQPKSQGKAQRVNLLVIQKQIIADTTALARNAPADEFKDLASRQKDAADLAGIYKDTLSGAGAPEEAVSLMEDAKKEMTRAGGSLAGRQRDPALPPEEKALADLYQVLKLMPQLGNMPVQPPSEQEQARQNQMVRVVLEAIKKQKQASPSNEELAEALEKAREVSRTQASVNEAVERPGHAVADEGQAQPNDTAQSGNGKQGQRATPGSKAGQAKEGQQAEAGSKAGEGKQGQQAQAGSKPGEAKEGQQAEAESKPGEGKEGQQAGAGSKAAEAKEGQQPGAGTKASEGKEGQQAAAGMKGGEGKEGQKGQGEPKNGQGKADAAAKDGSGAGQGKEGEAMEGLAEQETQLSKEAAELAEKLQRLAGKDVRLGHNAGAKMAQASKQMAGAAKALQQGRPGLAGTEGAQGLMNVNKVIAMLERILKDQPKLTDAAAEDYPKEYEAIIAEYLRRLSHAK